VQAALASGALDPGRWTSYTKLQRELAHLERRLDKRAQAEERKRWAKLGAEARLNMRVKGRR
jgi:ribosome biogenesis GTPase